MLQNIINLIKKNILVTILMAVAAVAFIFPKQLKKMFGAKPRRRRRRPATVKRTVTRTRTRSGKPIPRSVGTKKGYAAAAGGTIPLQYNKDGSVKKAWQVAGTLAAKQRMSRLRKSK